MLQERPENRPNIYQVHEMTCRLRGVSVRIENVRRDLSLSSTLCHEVLTRPHFFGRNMLCLPPQQVAFALKPTLFLRVQLQLNLLQHQLPTFSRATRKLPPLLQT